MATTMSELMAEVGHEDVLTLSSWLGALQEVWHDKHQPVGDTESTYETKTKITYRHLDPPTALYFGSNLDLTIHNPLLRR